MNKANAREARPGANQPQLQETNLSLVRWIENQKAFPSAMLTIFAHNNKPIPNARVEKEITTFSLFAGPSTERNCVISSVMSSAPHTNNNVSGLSAVTARSPIPPSASVPAHVKEFVTAERVMAVSRMVKVSAAILKASGHESLSARNKIGFMNILRRLPCRQGKVERHLRQPHEYADQCQHCAADCNEPCIPRIWLGYLQHDQCQRSYKKEQAGD